MPISVSIPETESNIPERQRGAIRALKVGYGFIAGDDGHDYFFHWSAMDKDGKNFRDLSVQERVEFSLTESDRGMRAILVCVI